MMLTNLTRILFTVLIICISSNYSPSFANKNASTNANPIVCEIFDLTIEPLPCDPNNLFSVELDFEFVDVTNSFTLEINGEFIGEYLYIDLPITVGNLIGDGSTPHQFIVSDLIEPNCSALEQIAPVSCTSTPENCVNFNFLEDGENYGDLENGEVLTVENDITVTVVGYNGTLFEYIEAIVDPFCGPFPAANDLHVFIANGLNFNFAGLDNTSITYDYQTCANEGSFSIDGGDFVNTYYANSPDTSFNLSSGHFVQIIRNPTLDSEGHVTITGELENLTIQGLELSLDNICYSTDPLVCAVSNLVVTPQDCNPNGTYDILVDFTYLNPNNDLFDLYDANGNIIGTYALANLPILHENFVPSGEDFDILQVCINDNATCCSSVDFLAPECTPPCELSDLTIVPTGCDGNFFGVIIDFDFSNASSTFSVVGNGNDYGDFNYVDLPIMIGGLEGDGTSGYEFLITDNEFPNCSIFDQIGAVDCNPVCEITNVEAYYECISNSNSGTSYLHLDLEAENANDLTFMINVGSNDPIGPYEYQDFPIFIGIPTSGSNILVYSVEDPNCTYSLDVPVPDCTCGATDFTYEFITCTTNGWELTLDFEYNNPDEDFEVRDNDDNLLGTFNTSQLPITLEAPIGENNGIFSVRLHFCFLETECCTFENFQGPYCTGECNIFNGSISNSDCDDNGLIDLTFDFNYENVSDSFYIIIYDIAQEEYGPFSYNDLPVTISDLEADGGIFIINVVDNEPNPSSNCLWVIDHPVPNCFGPNECIINEVIVEAYCNESGTHDVLIDLDIENVNNNTFFVDVTGFNYDGEYTIDEFPILIEDYEYFFNFITVSISDIEDPGCAGNKNIPLPQCEFCIGFDNLEDGVDYGNLEEGDTLTTENDVVVTVVGYAGTNFDYIEAITDPFCGPFPSANGIHIFMFNGLNFDYSALNSTSSQVSFDFHTCDPGGEFSVNGAAFTNFFYSNSLDTTFTLNSGHEVQIVRNPNVDWEGNVTITGAIENLSIQGIELAIDNICYQVAPPPCDITDLVLEAGDCGNMGEFYIDLDFNATNASDSFYVTVNTINQGYFAYDDLPITVGPFEGNGEPMQVIVHDAEDENCWLQQDIEAPVCDPVACELFDPESLFSCTGEDLTILLYFEYTNTSDSFSLIENGVNFGNFAYSDLPISVGPFIGDGQTFNFLVEDQQDMSCSLNIIVETTDCVPNCIISNFVSTDPVCNSNGGYDLTLDFVYQNPGNDFFDLFNADFQLIGTYALSELPLTLENYEPFYDGLEVFLACINDQPNCCLTLTLEFPECDPPVCEIDDLVLEAGDCGNMGEFYIDLDFNTTNASDSFYVTVNTINQGYFAYDDLPITVGPFEGNGEPMQVIVHDAEDENCWWQQDIEAPVCNLCNLNSTATVEDCDDDGNFSIIYTTANDDPNGTEYQVLVDGVLYGTYNYSQSTVEIGPLEGNGQTIVLTSIDIDDPNCSTSFTVLAPDCDPPVCEIWELIAEAYDCDDNGNFLVDIDFNFSNTSDSFTVVGNGQNYGTFAYADLFITLGPFDGNGQTLEFIIIDQENQNCTAEIGLDAPNCDPPTCEIGELNASNTPCDINGNYTVNLDFDFANTSDSFEVFIFEQYYGTFAYTDLPIDLGEFNIAQIQTIQIEVFDINSPNCSSETFYVAECLPFCDIFGLETSVPECNPSGGYDLILNFSVENPSNDFFELFDGAGNLVGFYALADLPITLTNYVPTQNDVEVFQVCINDNPNCCEFLTVEFPECDPPPCEIWDVVAEAYDCDDDGNFLVDLDFNFANTSDSFTVVGNGQNYGTFAYTDLFITIGPFDGNGQTLEFIIIDQENQNCFAEIGLDAPTCNSCFLNATATVEDCDDDGNFYIIYTTVNNDPNGTEYQVLVDGILYGTYNYSQSTVEIGPLEGNGQAIVLTSIDVDDPNCSTSFTVLAPDCDPVVCEITGFETSTPECNPNGGYDLVLGFSVENPGNDFFDLFDGAGNLIGFYALADLPITLTNYVPTQNDVEVFQVCINDNPNCCEFLTVEFPECDPPPCEIWDLVAEAYDCDDDGNFLVDIDFNFANTSDSFTVVGNGQNYGTFAYTDLFITIGPFDGNGQTLEFIIIDQENQNCTAEIGLDAPTCSSCFLNATATVEDCDDDGNFYIIYTTANNDPNGTEYQVLVDGVLYGTYNYSQSTVEIGPLEGNGQAIVLTSIDVDDPNCSTSFTVLAPNCDPAVCEIWDLIAEAYDCDDMGQFLVDVDFNFSNTSDSFDLYVDGNLNGTFAYTDLFVTVGPFDGNGQVMQILVVDEDAGCEALFLLEAPNCDPAVCEISGFETSTPECNPNGGYDLVLGFSVENPENDFFELFDGAGNLVGFYALADLPITLTNYVPTQNDIEVFQVCINDNPNCCAILTVEFPECDPPPCEIWDLVAEAYDCDDDGNFLVDLDFNFANTSDSFSVVGNGNNYGTFAYTDLYITLGPFEGNGQTLEFIIIDQENQNCTAEIGLDAPSCDPTVCEIGMLDISNTPCDPNGIYTINLDFDYSGTSDSFEVFIFSQYYGTFAYTDLPISLGDYDIAQIQTLVIEVIDLDNPNCSVEAVYVVDCTPPICEINDLIAEAYDCDDMGQFLIDIDFNYTNTSDSFDLYIDGNLNGTFAYTDLFVTVGPFDGNGQVMQILVVDEDAGCEALFLLEAPNCDPAVCEISGLETSVPECNPNGGYDLVLGFSVENPENDFFDLFDGAGNLIGFYALADLPITLTNYIPTQNDIEVFQVCINDNPNCCAILTVEFPECDEDCEISNLELEPFCDDDALYVEITFDYNGNGSDSFQILSCAPIGNFEYNGNGVYIVEIPEDLVNCAGGDFIPIGIFDLENNACGDTEFLFIPDCYETNCIISNVTVIAQDCNDDDEFFVTIDFEHENTGSMGFNITEDGEEYGDFEYDDLPITVGPFPGNGQDLELIITDNEDNDCWNLASVTGLECTPEASTCIEFEGLTDGLNYGGSNSQAGDLLMIENEVLVTMEGVPDPLGNLNYDYMFATTQDICNPFDAASGNRTFMFNGLRFDFSPLTENPTLVTFPYHNCGIPFAISVNDQQPVTYLLPTSDTTFNLSPTVSVSIEVDPTNNSEEGFITLEGFIGSFFIGGVELQIDNVCFNVENLVPDVWPGDANFDNTANNLDLLNVGIAYGSQGEPRDMSSIDWFAMPAEDWLGFYADEETNYKHADCDGNGEVDIDDREAILENYDLTHGPVPIFVPYPGTPNDPPFFVDLPDAGDIILGQTFEAPIILGTPATPVEDIYGIAFTVEFPTEMMDEDQVFIEIGDSWMGEDGQSIIHLNKKFAVDGKIEVAITRINQTNISGQGQVASFIGIIDDILGRSELGVEITHVSAIDFNENPVPLYRTTEVIDLAPTTVPDPEQGSLDIYPSPTVDLIKINNTTGEQILEIQVYNVLGQLMLELNNPSDFETIQVSDWAAGIYIVRVELETETVTERVKKALP